MVYAAAACENAIDDADSGQHSSAAPLVDGSQRVTSLRSHEDRSGETGAVSRMGMEWAAVAICAIAIAVRIYTLRATHCTIEDALISLRYAENIAHGDGFVYNPGERVLGTTTPLFTLILALGAATPVGGLAVGKAISIIADAAVCYFIFRLMARLAHPIAGLAAALFYATASAPINFSIGGMETALVTLCSIGAIYAYAVRRPKTMCGCLALLALFRVDGLLLGGVLIAAWTLGNRRIPWKGLGVAALIVMPWIVFAIMYFGSLVPQSALAKLVVYQHASHAVLPNRRILAHQFFGDAPHAVLFLAALVGGIHAWRRLPVLRPPVVWSALYHLAILASRAPVEAFGWYFVPPYPVYCAAVGLGLHAVWRQIKENSPTIRHAAQAVPAACIVLLAIGLIWNIRSIVRSIGAAQRREDTLRRTAGIWLADHAPAGATMLTESIGYLGYYSRLRVLDMVGLVSPEVVESYRRSDYPLADMIEKFHPEVMVLRTTERDEIRRFSSESGRPIIDDDYFYVRGFDSDVDRAYLLLYRRKDVVMR